MLRAILDLTWELIEFDFVTIFFFDEPARTLQLFEHWFRPIDIPIADFDVIAIYLDIFILVKHWIEDLKIDRKVFPAVIDLHIFDRTRIFVVRPIWIRVIHEIRTLSHAALLI